MRGGRLVAYARDQQPFEAGEKGIESCSLRAFLREPPCGTCKKDQDYRITDLEAQIKTNKQANKQTWAEIVLGLLFLFLFGDVRVILLLSY